MLNIIKNTINRVFASGVDSDASAFITATGLSGTTQKSAITTLVKDLKSSGLWSKMKAVYPMVTDNYNLLSYTEDFTNAFWSKYNSTITANTTTAPNGTLTADSFNDGAANNYHQVYTQINSLPIGTYTFSFYLKSNTNTKNIAIYPFGTATPGGTGTGGVILTQNGTFVANASGGVVSYGSQDVGNGWRRFYVVGTSTAISNVYPVISYADGTNVIYTGTNTDAYIWGAQYELGSTMSTYQPIATTPSAYMASQMKYNLKDPRDLDAAFRLTWSGGWTYSATGATPNGTNAYADTKLSPFNNLSQNSFHSSAYLRTPLSTAQTGFGVIKADFTERTDIINYTGTLYSSVGTSATQVGTSVTPYQSLILGSRLNSTSNSLYVGGVLRANSIVSNSANLPSNNYYLGTVNQNISFYNNSQVAFSTIGNGLNDQDAQLLNQIVEKYQVALSRGVQAAQSFYYNSVYSNEANTYLYSTQITGTTQVSAINTLINGLKANNLWTKMKAVYPFVTDYRNLVAYTQSFTNAYWDKSITTVIDANTTDPNGTTTASKLTEAAGTGSHHIHNSIGSFTPVVGQAYAMSCYVKQTPTATNRYVQLPFFIAGFGSNAYVNFDVQTGVVGTIGSSITSYSITLGNDGWYRITATATATATGVSGFQLSFIPSSTSTRTESYTVTAGNEKSIYMWGVQIEMGSTASVYQPVLGVNNYSTNVAAQMKFNLVNPQDTDAAFRLAFSGGWTYSTNGAQPNGTNGYADTKLGQTAAGMFTNSHLSFYSRTNSTTATGQVEMGVGATVAGTFTNLLMRLDTSTNYVGGSIGSRNALSTAANSIGHVIVNALSASAKAYKNGSLVATDTSTQTGTLNSLPIYIGCQNNNSVPGAYTTRQAAFASIGDGLSDAEAALLYSLVQQFQTDLTRQV
jgi:hypothetical protein